ncbi:hypothetical protein [Cupriavidus numazuensis]|uniref:hypothetical protein n=1 Tax=Cupriavidus numazuensis TaxID=221992 RepID=UPI001BA76D78|nr:hypothetical protein [Cupriavidus numazuensis]
MYALGYSTEAPRSTTTTAAASSTLSPAYERPALKTNTATVETPTITELQVTGVCEKLVVSGRDLTLRGANLRRTVYPNGWNAMRVEIGGGQTLLFSTRPEVVVSPELSSFNVETFGLDAGRGEGVSFLEASGQCQIRQSKVGKKLTCEMQTAKDGRKAGLSFRFSP